MGLLSREDFLEGELTLGEEEEEEDDVLGDVGESFLFNLLLGLNSDEGDTILSTASTAIGESLATTAVASNWEAS